MTIIEDNVSQPVIDNPTCKLENIFPYGLIKLIYLKGNINPLNSAESQDNTNLSGNSRDDGMFESPFRSLAFV
jgi:hypothetical protein